jgi:UDP-N-acetylmuramate dehydrogenase
MGNIAAAGTGGVEVMSFPDISADLAQLMPELRGRMSANQPLAPYTWFKVGGPAQILFSPADEADLAYFLARLPGDIAVTHIGLGSNLIVRDGGVPGVTIRLGGRAFGEVEILDGARVRVGAAMPDQVFARKVAEAGIAGLEFYCGIPGSIGGALRMNAGAHGGETTDVLIEARGVDRQGAIITFSHADMGYSYRHSDAPEDVIFTSALFQGKPDAREDILVRMAEITKKREESQPIREKTGGSTFANPKPQSAWKVVDAAGCCFGARIPACDVLTNL